MNDWVFDIENKIYTIVKAKTYNDLKAKFPQINFTTSDEVMTSENKFPTVYIHELQGVERGADLEGDSINAILSTFEVKVTVNTKNSDAKTVYRKLMNAFKELRFNAAGLPIMSTNANMYVMAGRFERLIGADDKI